VGRDMNLAIVVMPQHSSRQIIELLTIQHIVHVGNDIHMRHTIKDPGQFVNLAIS
jgi:hypothetical protein